MAQSVPFRFDDLQGMTLLITGTTRGIGKALLPALIDQGLNLVLVGQPLDSMRAIRAQMGLDAARMRLYACDLADPQATAATAERIHDEVPTLDGLLHNAAIDPRHRFEEPDEALWQRVWQVNVHSPVTLTRALLPRLRHSSRGRIVFVGSVMAELGGSYMSAYASSKRGLEGLTHSLAHELKGTTITVNCLVPGAIQVEKETGGEQRDQRLIDWQAVPRRLTPHDLLGPLCLLLSEAGGGITGQSITVDGSLIHPLADRTAQQGRLEADAAERSGA